MELFNHPTMKFKVIYFFTVIITILCGILVRAKKEWFPQWVNLWLGDFLYAFMMYFIVALLCRNTIPLKTKAIIAVLICYCIELSQLYQAEWINAVRGTLPGRLVLGNGFLWTDLAAYTAGIAAAFCVDILWIKRVKTTT